MSLRNNLSPQWSPNLVGIAPYMGAMPDGCTVTRKDSAFYLPIIKNDKIIQWYGYPIGPTFLPGGETYFCRFMPLNSPLIPGPVDGGAVVWSNGSYLVLTAPDLTPGCYRGVCQSAVTPTSFFETTPFEYIENPCFTSVIEFGGCESQLGYPYSLSTVLEKYQTARIWAYLDDEQLEEESDVFRGSNGKLEKIFARMRRKFAFKAKTTYIWRQNAIRMAFAHDYTVLADNKYGILELVNDEGFEVVKQQTYPPNDLADLSGKVYASNYLKVNNFCNNC